MHIERDNSGAPPIEPPLPSERVIVAAGAVFCLVVATIAASGGLWWYSALNLCIGVFVAHVAAGMRISKRQPRL